MPGPQTVFSSIGPEWATVSNTPYRSWKIESFEGGVRTPMIACWPKGMLAKKGSITNQPGHVMDFMATFINLAQVTYPKNYQGNSILPMDGLTLVPILKGEKRKGHDALFNEHNNRRYARQDDWKIVSTSTDTIWQLYNIKNDAGETANLAATYPEKVKQLDGLWQLWATRKKVYPKPVK
jgi:arylsulfatase